MAISSIQKTALVPYSAQNMFDLVSDVESYPQFLPWCKAAEIHDQDASEVKASLTLAVKGIEKTFTTRNPIVPGESIEMHLLDGPFKQLHGYWQFQSLGTQGCKISMDVKFEIKNPLLRATLGPVFTHIVNTLIESFIQRAGELYGNA